MSFFIILIIKLNKTHMHQTQQDQYQLFRINQDSFQYIVNFIYANYIKNQPLTAYLNIDNDQYINIYKPLIFNACKDGLSFGYKYKNQIVAITLAPPYQDYIIPVQSTPTYEPVQILFCQAQKLYFPKKWQKTIYLSFAYTKPQHRSRGLFGKIVQNIELNGQKEGFNQFMADCTNPKSESVLVRLGYQVKGRIFYKDFEYKGTFPLQKIESTASLSILSKEIKNKGNDLKYQDKK